MPDQVAIVTAHNAIVVVEVDGKAASASTIELLPGRHALGVQFASSGGFMFKDVYYKAPGNDLFRPVYTVTIDVAAGGRYRLEWGIGEGEVVLVELGPRTTD
jgi:hypothetical protein